MSRPTSPDDIRARLLAFRDTGDPAELDAAVHEVQRLLDAPALPTLDPTARAYLWTLGAVASTQRARGPAAQPGDLDRAIDWTTAAAQTWPAENVNRSRALSNLATALADRFDERGDPDDLARAIRTFEAAIPEMLRFGERVDVAEHGLGVCLHVRASTGDDLVADLDRAIALFQSALDNPDVSPEERAGYGNSLGLSLRRRALAIGRTDALHIAERAYRDALAQAEPDGSTAVAIRSNLAVLLLDIADAAADPAAVREAVALYRGLLPMVGPDRHEQLATNLGTALVSAYRFTRDRALLDEAMRSLRAAATRLPEPGRRVVALSALAAALHEMFEHTGGLAFLDEAIIAQEGMIDAADGRTAARLLNLGIGVLARFRRRRERGDLDRAVALFAEAAAADGSKVDTASAHNSHANALSLLYDLTSDREVIDRAIARREDAVATAAVGSLDAAVYRANLGVDLLKRFERDADAADLERAVAEQRAAVALVPATSADQPRLLAALADSLARHALAHPHPDAVAEARAAYRAATAAGRVSLPEQALGAAMRWGDWEARRRCWSEAAQAYSHALRATADLVEGQQSRADKESWLADAQTVPAAAGYALVRSAGPQAAAVALEQGRAVLLAEALRAR